MNEMLMSTMTTMSNTLPTDYESAFNAAMSTVNETANAATFGSFLGVFAGMSSILLLVGLAIMVLTIIAEWKIFTKAGEEGWKSLIPIYNMVVLFKICGINPWWVLAYCASIIPVIGWIVVAGLTIYLNIKLAKAFGKETGFAVGLILLNTIFILILGFGDSEYQLEKA